MRAGARVIGVNNRDLSAFGLTPKPFCVSFNRFRLTSSLWAKAASAGRGRGSSGRRRRRAVLVGETLMRATEPAAAAALTHSQPRSARAAWPERDSRENLWALPAGGCGACRPCRRRLPRCHSRRWIPSQSVDPMAERIFAAGPGLRALV